MGGGGNKGIQCTEGRTLTMEAGTAMKTDLVPIQNSWGETQTTKATEEKGGSRTWGLMRVAGLWGRKWIGEGAPPAGLHGDKQGAVGDTERYPISIAIAIAPIENTLETKYWLSVCSMFESGEYVQVKVFTGEGEFEKTPHIGRKSRELP